MFMRPVRLCRAPCRMRRYRAGSGPSNTTIRHRWRPIACRAALGERENKRLSLLAEVGSNLLAGFNQTRDRLRRFLEQGALAAVEFDLDHALDPLAADHSGHA